MICDECETVAHCMKNGCVPKQNSVDRLLDEAKLLADDRPVEVEGLPEWAIDAEHTIRRLVKALVSEAIEQPSGVATIAPVQQPVAWRETHSKVIKALAAIVTVHTPDKLFDLDAIPRDPVMGLVQQIKSAIDGYKPPQRTWVGLTDEEIMKVWQPVAKKIFRIAGEGHSADVFGIKNESMVLHLSRAIEAAHGIKENT